MNSIHSTYKLRKSQTIKSRNNKPFKDEQNNKFKQQTIVKYLSGTNTENNLNNTYNTTNTNNTETSTGKNLTKEISFIAEPSATLTEYEKIVLKELNRFYTIDKIEKIKPIINQESDISLRLIDWTLTNYTKKYGILIRKTNGEVIDIYESYKACLDSYPKNELFDVFKRGSCIRFYYTDNEDDYIITSVKQLNIFRWILRHEILTYIEQNREKINNDHRESLRRSKKNKPKGKKSQRQELSTSAYRRCIRQSKKNVISLSK